VLQRKQNRKLTTALVLIVLAAVVNAVADEGSVRVVPEAWLRLLAGEVNGQIAFRNVELMSTYHRMLGSREMTELMGRLKDIADNYGLDDTRVERFNVETGREPFWLQDFGGQVPASVRHGELRLATPHRRLISSTDGVPSLVIQGSRTTDITAEVVYVGQGVASADYEGKAVDGRIVLAGNASPDEIKEMAIGRFGAAGVLYYRDRPGYSGDEPDANLGLWWWPWLKDGRPSTFGLSLSNNQYRFLKGLLDQAERVTVRVRIDAEMASGKDAGFEVFDTTIRGTEQSAEEFWLWAHMDHPYPAAVDNASGAAVVLEAARTLKALVDTGALPRPQRTLRFLLGPHVAGLSMYMSRHPERLKHVRGAVSVDGVGVDQTVYSSFLAISKPSQALTSYWTPVLRDLVEHLDRRTNRDVLRWDDLDNLYASDGSRHQYHLKLLPYTGGSDEFQTNEGTVGIPTIAVGTAPVPPRHSQVNGPKWLDATGLHRVSYLLASLSLVFGWTDSASAWRIIDEAYHQGRAELVTACELAMTALTSASPELLPSARRRADSLLEQVTRRQIEALESIGPLFPEGIEARHLIRRRVEGIQVFADILKAQLGEEHARLCAPRECRPEPAPLTKEQRALNCLIPIPVPGKLGTTAYFGDYYGRTLGAERLASFDLRPGFDYGNIGYSETKNFIDGRRSILDIHAATEAEIWSEGYPSSHRIGLEEAERFIRMLEAAGLVTIHSLPDAGH